MQVGMRLGERLARFFRKGQGGGAGHFARGAPRVNVHVRRGGTGWFCVHYVDA